MIISLTGPSGSGKGFVKRTIKERFGIPEVCWSVTRPLRPDEIDGVDREHLPLEQFKQLEQKGELLFVQRLFGNLYGVRRRYFDAGTLCLTEFHIDNLLKAQEFRPRLISIALVPCDETLLRERLKERGTENKANIAQRIAAAQEEAETISRHEHLFSLLVRISRTNEHTVRDHVISHLCRAFKTDQGVTE